MSPTEVAQLREKLANFEQEVARLQWQNAVQKLLASSAMAGIGGLGLGYLSHLRDKPVPYSHASERQVELPVIPVAAAEPEEATRSKQAFNLNDYFPVFSNPESAGPAGNPGMTAAQVVLPVALGLGGFHLGAHVSDKRRRLAAKRDLSAAKEEYEQSVARLFPGKAESENKSKQEKAAATPPAAEPAVDEMLDRIFVKLANPNPLISMMNYIPGVGLLSPELKGQLVGNYLTYAAGAIPLGYITVDSAMRGPNRNAAVAKALRERERLRNAARPSPLQITLKPRKQVEDDDAESN
jgi:hypothetical protein